MSADVTQPLLADGITKLIANVSAAGIGETKTEAALEATSVDAN